MSTNRPDHPFQSLAVQVADAIRQRLTKGTWHDQLPGENRLAAEFKVSRPTVAGLCKSSPGKGCSFLAKPDSSAGSARTGRIDFRC